MTEFTLEVEGPHGVFAVFSEDEGAGYFFAYKPDEQSVIAQVRVYVCSDHLRVHENDVRVVWSTDRTKCGVVIWGRMRAILDITNGREVCQPIEDRLSPAITDPEWLRGFDSYLDENEFVRARQRYWKDVVHEYEPSAEPVPQDRSPIQTNFILYANHDDKIFAVFEDDGRSGYMYVYSGVVQTVLRSLHVYDRSAVLNVTPRDVSVIWAIGDAKCGVAIWGKMRGVIDLANGGEGRVWMERRDSPGIGDSRWLEGF
jgi:hypothetical protein